MFFALLICICDLCLFRILFVFPLLYDLAEISLVSSGRQILS